MVTAPHAYSSDTLQKAYQWLQTNSQHHDSVHNSDQLVALYLSKKKGLQSFDFSSSCSSDLFLDQTTPAPIDNFKTSFTAPPMQKQPLISTSAKKENTIKNFTPVTNVTKPIQTITPALTEKKKTSTNPTDSFFALDKKSLTYLEDTKKTFNLSTQSEALRLLLSIGYEKLHKI